MTTTPVPLSEIPGLLRWETTPREEAIAKAASITKETWTHEEIYGQFCTLQGYIDAPPEAVYDYLADVASLDEYTYSTRDFVPTDKPGLFVGRDTLVEQDTKIFLRVVGDREALTLDYHCAWDQGDELWMCYLFRIIPAQRVLNKPGSVVVWTNCHHPYYDKNPYPELAPEGRPWVGDFWPLFWAGHELEFRNLRAILEARHGGGAAQSQ